MLRIAFLCLVVAAAAAFHYLPWWALVGTALALAVAARFLGPWLLKQLFMVPFRAKGAVLRGAELVVHGVTEAPEPPDSIDVSLDDGEEDTPEIKHFPGEISAIVELTITPRPQSGPFGMWEPGELRLVRSDAPHVDADSDEPDDARIDGVEWLNGAEFVPSDGIKLAGPARLRLRVGLRPGVRSFQLRYYFEELGLVHAGGPVELPRARTVSPAA